MSKADAPALDRFLARLLLRSPLTSDERAAILNLGGRAVQVDARQDFVETGREIGAACLVVDGLVARFDQTADGLRQTTALYMAGDMCNLHAVVSPVRGGGLQALTSATVCRISQAGLRELAAKYPAIALAFWRDTVADASVLAKWVSIVRSRSARSRIAHLLCEMGVRSEQAAIGSRTDFPLPMTQSQIAEALALTAVHVNRSMRVLREEGLMIMQNRRVLVERWDELATVAEFDPQYLLAEPRPGSIAARVAVRPSTRQPDTRASSPPS